MHNSVIIFFIFCTVWTVPNLRYLFQVINYTYEGQTTYLCLSLLRFLTSFQSKFLPSSTNNLKVQ